jgi:hypothetical protein
MGGVEGVGWLERHVVVVGGFDEAREVVCEVISDTICLKF